MSKLLEFLKSIVVGMATIAGVIAIIFGTAWLVVAAIINYHWWFFGALFVGLSIPAGYDMRKSLKSMRSKRT